MDHPAGLKAEGITKNSEAVSFVWKWKDGGQQAEGAERPENLLGNAVWHEGEPVSEPRIDDAYMEIAVFVKNGEGQYGYISGDQLCFSTEKKHMNLWQFWHYVGGYSWEFIKAHEDDLIKGSSAANSDDVTVTFAANRLITECATLDSEIYTIAYGLEQVKPVPGYSAAHPAEGADADRILLAEPEKQDAETGELADEAQSAETEDKVDEAVQDAVEDAAENLEKVEEAVEETAAAGEQLTEEQITALIEKIENAINALPAEEEVTDTMESEAFAALKESLQSIEADMEQLGEEIIRERLSSELIIKFQTVLKAYDNVRLEQIKQKIDEISRLNDSELKEQEDALRAKLTGYVNEVADIWADFNSGIEEDTARQKEINEIRENLIELLQRLSNWIDKPEGLTDIKRNADPVVLTWQWNDNNIQQAGATRPATPLFGIDVVWGENGPYGRDAYVRMAVQVRGEDGNERSMNLWEFLTKECGYEETYVKENFPVFASADSRLLVSNGHGSDMKTTWNEGRLITAYVKEGKQYTVSYGLEQIENREIQGYQVERKDEQTLIATPVDDFNATVVWYDNHNHYYDEKGVTPRPGGTKENDSIDFDVYKGKVQLVRYTKGSQDPEIVEVKIDISTIENYADSYADAWSVSVNDLPRYSPEGKEYTYYLKQDADNNGHLTTGVSTGAYYEPSITNDDLVEDAHPELVKDNGTLTNTLANQGKVQIYKEWKDGNTDPDDRPETTLHYYRITETDLILHHDETTHTFFGFNGSPVPGNDSRTKIQELANGAEEVEITLPEEKGKTLPLFDPYGRRYVYYAVERMENQGDYVTKVDNSNAGPILLPDTETSIIREKATADGHNYILNGATVTNKLEKKIKVPVTVEFKAQAIQNDMETAEVHLQLQYQDRDGNWHDYSKDGYDGTLTLQDFRAETMTLSGTSDEVDQYDDDGYKIEYRWVQTSIEVNNGLSGSLDGSDQDNVTVRTESNGEVGPGVDNQNTTLHFDVDYSEHIDNTKITNTLVGNTQVEVTKKWVYTDASGNNHIYSSENSEEAWDGNEIQGITLPEGAKWPAEIELKYPLLQNGKPYTKDGELVSLTIEPGETSAILGGLPRYDENGNEYTYTLNEQEPEGWFNQASEYTKSVQNDSVVEGDRVTQLTSANENIIGPGNPLVFEVSKEWEDDTDIATRYPVTVGVFNKNTGAQVGDSVTLTMESNWYKKIVINGDDSDTVDNYVVKEISVGEESTAVNVVYKDEYNDLGTLRQKAVDFNERFIASSRNAISARNASETDLFEQYRYSPEALNEYIVGTLGMGNTDTDGNLEFYYNVYLRAQKVNPNRAKYAIYNQRQGEIIYNLEKTWVNDGQKSKAYFAIERKVGEKWDSFKEIVLGTTGELNTGNTGNAESQVTVTTVDGKTTAKIDGIKLPKYDALGRNIEYRLRETAMSVFNGEGNEITQTISEDNIADFNTQQGNADKYTCTVNLGNVEFKQSQWLEGNEQGDSPHHSGDVYPWTGENTREDNYDISVYKVWRDGGLPVNELNAYNANRPDINFHLYRVSYRELREAAGVFGLTAASTTDDYVSWMKENIKSEQNIIASTQAPGGSAETTYNYNIKRVNDDYLWTTSTVQGHEGAEVNHWLWKCDISKQVPRYDENGSPYIYFLMEELRGNADHYVATYCNDTVASLTASGDIPNGEGTTTEETFDKTDGLESSFLLITDGGSALAAAGTDTPAVQSSDEENDAQGTVEEENQYGEYYARIVVNTRQRNADVEGKKTWNLPDGIFVGEGGIPYEQMPDVKLSLYRDKASVDENGEYVAASFEQAEKIDELTATGEEGKKFEFAFPSDKYKQDHKSELIDDKLPRYDEYGYRYSYWIVEEPIGNFTSPNMGEKDETTNTWTDPAPTPQAGVFDLTNTYNIAPPYVKIDLTKAWKWPDDVDNAKKNLIVTFNLHAVIAGEDGQPLRDVEGGYISDEIVDSKSIKVENGTATPANISFTEVTQGALAGSKLPYYAPNGQPYLYYVEEVQPNGYTVTSEVTEKDEIAPETETTTLWTKVKSTVANLFTSADSDREGTETATGKKTALFRPQLVTQTESEGEEVQTGEASIKFTNTYDGDLEESHSLTIKKQWNQWTDIEGSTFNGKDLSGLQPNQEIKVKLYRQWKLGGGSYGWEQVTESDVQKTSGSTGEGTETDQLETSGSGTDSTGWNQMNDDGTFTLSKINSWKLNPLTGLYKTAPNKEPYEYFVVEQGDALSSAENGGFQGYYAALSPDTHPDVSAGDTKPEGASFITTPASGMEKRRGYSASVIIGSKEGENLISVQPVNDLLYKKVSYAKKWEKHLDGAENTALSADELNNLMKTGALPEKIYFVVQYQIGSTGNWYYLPLSESAFAETSGDSPVTTVSTENIGSFVHREYEPEDYSNMNGSWDYLPAYAWKNNTKEEVNYRIVEVVQVAGADGTAELQVCQPSEEGIPLTEVTSDISAAGTIHTTAKTDEAPLIEEAKCNFINTVKVKPLVVRKVWQNDNANRDDTRPDSITIAIKKTDAADDKGITVTLTQKNLKSNSDGNIYESKKYYVLASQLKDGSASSVTSALTAAEAKVEGYTSSDPIPLTKETVDGKNIYVFTATNTLQNTTRKTIDLTANKTWTGENGVTWHESLRPAKITFTLQYRYKSKGDGTYTAWEDATNEATGIEGTATKEITSAAEPQTAAWNNVYQYYNPDGSAIPLLMEYRVVEKMYDESGELIQTDAQPYNPSTGNFGSNNGLTVTQNLTVTNTLKTVQVQVSKKWMGKDGTAASQLSAAQLKNLAGQGLLPDYIRFELYYKTGDEWQPVKTSENASASETVKVMSEDSDEENAKTLLTKDGEANTYTSDKKLPKYDKDGNEIKYRLVETGIYYGKPESAEGEFIPVNNGKAGDFTVGIASESVLSNDGKVVTTTNTNTLDVTELKVTKKWEDGDNQDGKRPDEITVHLIGKVDGEADPVYADQITLSAENNWTHTFTQLPKKWKGNAISYSIAEGTVDKYVTAITGNVENGFIITNTHTPEQVSIPVSKTWIDANNQDGKRPDHVTIHLLADGADTSKTLTLNQDNQWQGTFSDLPKYENGSLITYTISENTVEGYTTGITESVNSGFTVTNTHTPETIAISGTKTWVDDNDKAGVRPDSITLRIHGFVDGKEIALPDELSVISVTSENNWTWSVANLPKYDQGKEITYTVTEDWVRNYQTEIKEEADGYHITNTYVPPTPLPTTVNFSVIKKWNDEDNKDGLRPDQVVIRLYADGADTGKLLTLSEANHWTGSFTSLEAYKDGKEIAYTIKEDPAEGYTPEITGSAAAGFVVTNTHTPGTVDVSGKKIWKDNGDKAGKRPDSVTLRVHIFADGQEIETRQVKVTAEDGWKWSLGQLPEYKDGKKLTYTVTEDQVKGYQSRVDGFDVYNTYTSAVPTTLTIPVLKSWDDGNNRDRIRPASVVIRLYADGKYTGKMLTLSEKNGWKGSFKGLKESKDGKKIRYTIKEDAIGWYTASISGSAASGYVVTNYHKLGDLPPDEGLIYGPNGKNPNDPNGSGNGKYPGTGDDSRMLQWIVLMVSAAGALTAVCRFRRKKKTR